MKRNGIFKIVFTAFVIICAFSCSNDKNALIVDDKISLEEVDINESHASIENELLESGYVDGKKGDIDFKLDYGTTYYDGIGRQSKNIKVESEIKTSENVYRPSIKIIKTANARYKVKSIETATDEIQQQVAALGGYISEMRYQHNAYQKENKFTIKIPQTGFDETLKSMETIAEFVDHLNISTRDVTEEYVDVSSRLKTKLEVKARYEAILRNKAKTVDDILNTEAKLRMLQEEIESAQGRLNYLSNRVSLSTIQVELYEPINGEIAASLPTNTFAFKMRSALKFGLEGIEAIVLFFIHIWPLLITGTIIILWWKRKRSKKLGS
ncbi:MAG: DUF4349 domain-containing protein [Flavobacteriaceae bacterium]|nr:DUF4349 domain-containing protein [Flavobacteriaceae bacterium]